jgi:hypothetical protein
LVGDCDEEGDRGVVIVENVDRPDVEGCCFGYLDAGET